MQIIVIQSSRKICRFVDQKWRVDVIRSKLTRIIRFKDDVIQTKNSEDQTLLVYGAQSHVIIAKEGFDQ